MHINLLIPDSGIKLLSMSHFVYDGRMDTLEMIKIRQEFDDEHIDDIEGKVVQQICESGIKLRSDTSIAIAVGSRGVKNIDSITKATASCVRSMGGRPFIVPAMGSHGGATAEGQKQVLTSYGITEKAVGAPIRASMEVVELPGDNLENRVFFDKTAFNADGTIVINRIKPHTDFHGPHESGLMKLCTIGLGNHRGALEIHSRGIRGLKELIVPTARRILEKANVILGLGIVENAYDDTLSISAVVPQEMEKTEKKLLDLARAHMPGLPVDALDILILDELGKEISGSGLDTTIVGRLRIPGEEEPERPRISCILVTDLTEASHGNAIGMGLVDLITKKFHSKIDFESTYENVVTSTFSERGKIPIIANDDEQALEFALRLSLAHSTTKVRCIRIKNTLCLGVMLVSKSILEEIKEKKNIAPEGDFADILDPGSRSLRQDVWGL